VGGWVGGFLGGGAPPPPPPYTDQAPASAAKACFSDSE
jgi:hypothetical protein